MYLCLEMHIYKCSRYIVSTVYNIIGKVIRFYCAQSNIGGTTTNNNINKTI